MREDRHPPRCGSYFWLVRDAICGVAASILGSYNLHANCYITKPIDLSQFIKAAQSVEEFWFTIVQLPPNGGKK